MKLTLEFCAHAMNARLVGGTLNAVASGCSTDSRTLAPHQLFCALKGDTHDGHDHAGIALEKGAAAVIVDHEMAVQGAQLVVADTLIALQQLAAAARVKWSNADASRRVIAITGSAGKTTTKEAIAAALATKFRVGKTSGNYNNHIGVPLSVLNLPDECDVAVLEIGMNHAGEIRTLASIARPHIGVVTNVGTAHIENFTSPEGIAHAKRELIEALPDDGIAVLNGDDNVVRGFADAHRGRTILFGTKNPVNVCATDVAWNADGSEFSLDGADRFRCPLPARGGLMSALAAIATGVALGLEPASLKDAIAHLAPPKMRLQRIERNGMVLWDDCYNSNPEAAKMMLELLAATPAERRIAVLGEMRELGTWSEELHRKVGEYAVQCEVSVLVGIRGAARHLVDAAKAAGLRAGAAYFFEDPQAAGSFLRTIARQGDSILFKGSRGTRVELALEEFLR